MTLRVEPMAVGWGGLAGSVGLIVGAGRDWPLRLIATGAAFLVGGLLAGLRARGSRTLHALVAWIVAWLLYAVFVLLAAFVDLVGGPPEPEFAPGSDRDGLVLAGWTLAFALIGAGIAHRLLRPARPWRPGRR